MEDKDGPIFSVPLNVAGLPKKGRHFTYDADEKAREQIAGRFDLIEVRNFKARSHAVPWNRDGVEIGGRIEVEIVQPCAITGEPLTQFVVEEVEGIYVPANSKSAKPLNNRDLELIIDPMGDDVPETFEGEILDLASIWLEFFALGLDPFAKSENAEMNRDKLDAHEESPFAVLASLKEKLN